MAPRLFHERIDQSPADAAPLTLRRNGNRANLGKVRSIEMESPATNDLAVFLRNHKISNVFAQLRDAPRKQCIRHSRKAGMMKWMVSTSGRTAPRVSSISIPA